MTPGVKTGREKRDDSKKMAKERLQCVILKVKCVPGSFCHALAK